MSAESSEEAGAAGSKQVHGHLKGGTGRSEGRSGVEGHQKAARAHVSDRLALGTSDPFENKFGFGVFPSSGFSRKLPRVEQHV